MQLHSRFFLRTAVAVLGATVIVPITPGQGYFAATDPLVQRSVSHGEQMRSSTNGESDRELTVRDWRWSVFVLRSRVAPYPPLPPVLGDEGWASGALSGAMRPPAAEFMYDVFYSGYATLLASNRLPVKEASRVATYQAARQDLVQQIQVACDQLVGQSADKRRTALAALWVRQEAALQALTAEAEALRHDLAWVDSFYGNNGILGDPNRLDPATRDFFRLYGAAYEYAGLSTEQRRLLPEIAYDRRNEAAPAIEANAEQGARRLSFLPATARVALPDKLPPALDEKIRAFVAKKTRVKDELRAAVLAENYFWVRSRTQRLEALAITQAPQFAELELLAEEIRVGLAELDPPERVEPSPLPADLTGRVGTFYARKVLLQREVLARLRTLRTAQPKAQFELVRQGEGLAIKQSAGGTTSHAVTEFNASLARRYTEFAEESAVLRRDIQRFNETRPDRVDRTVDQLAADFAKAYASQENQHRFRAYRRAVLEPGLSPAQRQVLLQAAAMEFFPNP